MTSARKRSRFRSNPRNWRRRALMPALSVGDFSLRGGKTDAATLCELLSSTAAACVTMHPDIHTVDADYATLLAFHGLNVYPWTCYDLPNSQAAYVAGYRAITTNCPDFSANYPISVERGSFGLGFGADAAGYLVGKATYRNGASRNALAAPLVLEGDLVLGHNEYGWYVAGGTHGTVALGCTYEGGSTPCTRWSEAFTVRKEDVV